MFTVRGECAWIDDLKEALTQVDLLCSVNVGSIGENADGHAGTGDVRKLDGATETLVSLGVIVLQTDL
jgi:hypothetical protein